MTMETEPNYKKEDDMDAQEVRRNDIISYLTSNEGICFKNQQKWEPDLTNKEKFDIALSTFQNSKVNFLLKFGHFLKLDQLEYFRQFTEQCEPECDEIKVILTDLYTNCSSKTQTNKVKNRRFEALKQLIQEDSYFSEIEMMKRNPLLYEHLVGRYLTKDEIRKRDKYELNDQATFVKILMEGIERDNAELFRRKQEETENEQIKEEDTSDEEMEVSENSTPSFCMWGEFEELNKKCPKRRNHLPLAITPQERLLLKQEFVTTMYQNFLDGKDDFNYENIDNDATLDNLDELDQDAEDDYFSREEPEEGASKTIEDSSEDELDMYMNALNQSQSTSQLSEDFQKL